MKIYKTVEIRKNDYSKIQKAEGYYQRLAKNFKLLPQQIERFQSTEKVAKVLRELLEEAGVLKELLEGGDGKDTVTFPLEEIIERLGKEGVKQRSDGTVRSYIKNITDVDSYKFEKDSSKTKI